MTKLALSRIHFPVTTLGPGKRIGIWFQGCSIRCSGCISLDTWAPDRGITNIETVLHTMRPFLAHAEGLTISGGEPFDQLPALHAILTAWRSLHAGDTLVYSGYSLETLTPQLGTFAGLIDALITDPFQLEMPQTQALRGSDNQRLIPLTATGFARLAPFNRPLHDDDRALCIMFEDDTGTVFLAGIPRRGDLEYLSNLMSQAGHRIVTTQDKTHVA